MSSGQTKPAKAVNPVETVAGLRALPDVRDAVVTERVGPAGGVQVLGYVAGPDPVAGTAELHRRLMARLPQHLIPDYLFILEEIPLTPAGDYDLRVLPEPDTASGPTEDYVEPRTKLERQIAELMVEVLRVPRVGAHDVFFALGGSSAQMFRLTLRIREIFNVQLELQEVFGAPTVEGVAALVLQSLGEKVSERVLERQEKHRRVAATWLWIRKRVPPGLPCGAQPDDLAAVEVIKAQQAAGA